MITKQFKTKFINYVKKLEDEKLKLYDDGTGVPTIGIGFALINKINSRKWEAYEEDFLKDLSIDLGQGYDVIKAYAKAKSENVSTDHLKKQLDDLNFTITHDTALKLLDYSIEQKYKNKIKPKTDSIGEQVWDNLSIARQVAIMDHAFHNGNIKKLKDNIIAGEFKKVADTIKNLPGDNGLKARYTLRAKMIEEDAIEFAGIHIVEFDEHTFTQVANKCHISVAELQKLNPQIENINKIYKGQMINVPEDFFAEHHQELNTIIGSNIEFTNTFNQYKYDSFLNIYYNKADAYEYIKGASSIGGKSQNISVPMSSGEFYISLQVAHHPASFFTIYPIDRKIHAPYTKMLITDIKRYSPPDAEDTSPPDPQASKTPPMSIKRIGLDESQYHESVKYAQNYMRGEIKGGVYQIAQQDTISFVQSVYNTAGLPNHFSSLYTELELKNLNTENALKLLREHGSRETVKDPSSLLQDLSQILPITTNEWIAQLNTALYKHFTPSPLLSKKSLTSQIFGVGNTNSVETLYQSIEAQRQAALMLKKLAEQGYTFDKFPPAMQESSKFLNFIKFNDLVLCFNKTISIVQDDCNKLLEQMSDKSSDDYLKATKYVNDTITELKNNVEQLTANIANNFYYMKEILNTNKDIETLYYNITSKEDSHINKIETLLRIGTTRFTTEEYHEEASHKVKRETDGQKIDNEKMKFHVQISNDDIEAEMKFQDNLIATDSIANTNILTNLGNTALNHTPLLSDASTTNLVSTANASNVDINSVLMLGNLFVRMMNKSDNKTTDHETIISNDTVTSEYAHNLAYNSYKPAIDGNEDNVDLLG